MEGFDNVPLLPLVMPERIRVRGGSKPGKAVDADLAVVVVVVVQELKRYRPVAHLELDRPPAMTGGV